ncbi:MAG: hypothetical protein EOP34_08045 [Rickettsiales bacterium]|nr:MAG: hypothetical protein EOP34_08045 [Rickettsiales bacterium]
MEIIESDWEEYDSIFNEPYHIFNRAKFNLLNKSKCEELKFLLFKDKKYRLGFIGGVRDTYLVSPVSAPFGGFSFLNNDIQITQIEQALLLLEEYAKQKGLIGIKISLPPIIYNETFIAKSLNVFYRSNYTIQNLDLDFYLNLKLMDNYLDNIWYNAKKNIKISLNHDLEFIKTENEESFINEVYEVIRENREFKGKPLNMTLNDILETAKVIDTDFFLVRKNEINVASAIIFHATNSIMYVPFWGDKPGNIQSKPMNFISYKVFEYYYNIGKKYIHIGISTENSVPNYGLCEFKESLGCTITPKFTFSKTL